MTEHDDILLNDYLDGLLDDGREEEFFAHVAQNPSLRRELNDSLRLRSALRMEASSIIPPADISKNLFATLGYAPQHTRIITAGMLRWGGYLVAAILGGFIVWLFMLGGNWNSHNQTTANTNSLRLSSVDTIQMSATTHATKDNHTPTFAKEEQVESNNENASDVRRALMRRIAFLEKQLGIQSEKIARLDRSNTTLTNTNSSLNAERESLIAEYTTNKQRLLETEKLLEKVKSSPVTNSPSQVPLTTTNTLSNPLTNEPSLGFEAGSPMRPVQLPNTQQNQGNKVVEVSLRQLLMRSSSSIAIASNDNIGLYNVALQAVLPDVLPQSIPNLAVGIEVGREQFVQQYRDIINGQAANVTQRPTLWWGGLVARYSMKTGYFNDAIFPMLQMGGGLAESGYYYRASAGLRFEPMTSVAFTLGFEQSWLNYSAPFGTYRSSQNGFTTGIGFQF